MNDTTVLMRQIHPSFIHDGRVTSQAFRPTPKDMNHLSVYDGDMISPSDAYRHYTEFQKFTSDGVLGFNVLDCKEIELNVSPDPEPFPEHAVVDFSNFKQGAIQKKAKILKNIAEKNGWLYQPY